MADTNGLELPVFDLSPAGPAVDDPPGDLVDGVRRMAEDIGFFIVVGHGVPGPIVERMVNETRAFFEHPLDEKMRWRPDDDRGIGFRPVQSASLAQELEPGAPPDLMEVFRYEEDPADLPDGAVRVDDLFPTTDMRDAWHDYIAEMIGLGERVLRLFATALELPLDWFAQHYQPPAYKLIANHYPPQPTEPLPGQLRAGPHTDYGVLTILHQEDAPGGLQVVDQRTGNYHDAPFVPDSFVLNLGDLMAHWTNDRWTSTMHRVVNPPREHADRRRMSLPFFFNPNRDAMIRTLPSCITSENPARYEPVRAGDWVTRRYEALVGDDG